MDFLRNQPGRSMLSRFGLRFMTSFALHLGMRGASNDKRQTPSSAREFRPIFEASGTGACTSDALSIGLPSSGIRQRPLAAR
jgi:hypothetical protein